MKVTLRDERGVELTEITSHLGRSPGHMLVDWAVRPDALFHHYFERGGRNVTAVIGAAAWSAVLETRWQMGARFWFLRDFVPVDARARGAAVAPFMRPPTLGAGDTPVSLAEYATADLDVSAASPSYEPHGVPE